MNSNSKTFKFLSKFDRAQISQLYNSYDDYYNMDIVMEHAIIATNDTIGKISVKILPIVSSVMFG